MELVSQRSHARTQARHGNRIGRHRDAFRRGVVIQDGHRAVGTGLLDKIQPVRAEAGRQGLAEILWDVIPFDWINDANLAASTYMLKTQIRPGSVVLLHDTYSSTVDLVYQFLPVLIANGYHMVTVSHLLGHREPGTSYGGRENGPPANALVDIAPDKIPTLAPTPSPKPAPNLPITDIPNQNPGGPPA